MAAETVLDQSAVVNLAQRSPPEKTVGLDETYRATREVVQSMTGLPQPSNNLVFGFGAIAMEGSSLLCAALSDLSITSTRSYNAERHRT